MTVRADTFTTLSVTHEKSPKHYRRPDCLHDPALGLAGGGLHVSGAGPVHYRLFLGRISGDSGTGRHHDLDDRDLDRVCHYLDRHHRSDGAGVAGGRSRRHHHRRIRLQAGDSARYRYRPGIQFSRIHIDAVDSRFHESRAQRDRDRRSLSAHLFSGDGVSVCQRRPRGDFSRHRKYQITDHSLCRRDRAQYHSRSDSYFRLGADTRDGCGRRGHRHFDIGDSVLFHLYHTAV